MEDGVFADVPRRTAGTGGELEGLAAEFAKAKALQKAKEKEELLLEKHRQHVQQQQREQLANRRRSLQLSQILLAGFFLWTTYTHIVGIFLFTRGFLLTRFVLESQSNCTISPLPNRHAVNSGDGCWHPRTFQKAVIVLVDALRYDFTVPFDGKPEMPYHNAFTALYEIAASRPEHAVLLPFIADPPTTTLQRLKGLTTGTLPTFMDAGSNFAGTEIEEDNLIAQLRRNGRKLAFMGDDTWVSLFPGAFDIEYPYESLNVWDLHTVDQGVLEHIFPLLHPDNATQWDVLIGHFLGVDHAGHRYGPDHREMNSKLKQMDQFVRKLVDEVDENTLLVIMGDHGMDPKGDHGGESQLELEAALWMYSKEPRFGRVGNRLPPKGAWEKFVAQIDLVPTLALLLGLPIPYNNLGSPIEEAFIGLEGNDWENMAKVAHLTGAQIQRYQAEYATTSNSEVDGVFRLKSQWQAAEAKLEDYLGRKTKPSKDEWRIIYEELSRFQKDTLSLCKDLWARFDLLSMAAGVVVLLSSVATVLLYARGIFEREIEEVTGIILIRCLASAATGALGFWRASHFLPVEMSGTNTALLGSAIGGNAGFFYSAARLRNHFVSILPNSVFGWLSVFFVLSQAVMFAANSFTIWEDRILTYFLTTFALVAFVSSQRQLELRARALGTYHSLVFLVLTRLASLSRLCREEQMPYCESTYYASATSSVSAPWSLAIIFIIAVVFPSIVRSFYLESKSFEGYTVFFVNIAFRLGLVLVATFWTLDSADNGGWLSMPQSLLKRIKMTVAQVVLSIGFVAGGVFFAWAKMYLTVEPSKIGNDSNSSISSSADENPTTVKGTEENRQAKVKRPQPMAPATNSQSSPQAPSTTSMVLTGYTNLYGSRFFLLVLSYYLGLCLLQKPLGSASMGIMAYQLLSLLEIIEINSLSDSAIGPVICALLGASHYFSTGHQATLSSLQWESAFIPLESVKYPWSPMLIVGNTLGPQMLAALAVPATALWKQSPKKMELLGKVGRASATHVAYHLVISTATVMWAGHLRRHLMLYRVFSPRFMLGSTVLIATNVTVFLALCAVIWMITIGSATVRVVVR